MSLPWCASTILRLADVWHRLQEVFGGNAVSDEYGIGRHVANLFVTQTYEGQSDIHCEYPIARCRAQTDLATSLDFGASDHWHPSVLLSVEARAYHVCQSMIAAEIPLCTNTCSHKRWLAAAVDACHACTGVIELEPWCL